MRTKNLKSCINLFELTNAVDELPQESLTKIDALVESAYFEKGKRSNDVIARLGDRLQIL